jgi:ankyrin repeat protein
MKNFLYVGFITLTLSSGIMARTPCPKPVPNASVAFSMIEKPGTGSLKEYLANNIVAKTAQNERCETMYLVAIRSKNVRARKDLEAIGYGPKTAREVNMEYENLGPVINPTSNENHTLAVFDSHSIINSIFEYALAYGDWDLISELKLKGGKLLALSVSGKVTELMIAAIGNSKEVVEKIIRKGIDINAQDEGGSTALFYAAAFNTKEVVNTLIQAGSNIHHKDHNEYTALFYAAVSNSKVVVEELVKAGSDIHALAHYDTNIMLLASKNEHPSAKKMIEYLILNGVEINSKDRNNNTSLMSAASTNSKEIVELFIKEGDVNAVDIVNETALMNASYSNPRADVIETLINFGSDIDAIDISGRTPLMKAVAFNTKEVIETLIRAGANKEIKSKDNMSAYDYAIQSKRSEDIINLLKF